MHKTVVSGMISEALVPFWQELQLLRRRVLVLEKQVEEERSTRLRNVLEEVANGRDEAQY